jgi:nucleoside-diphosphate-sugar epimerase
MTSEYTILPSDGILVTGSNGFIGAKVIQILLEYGFANIRCLVRSPNRLDRLESAANEFGGTGKVEIITGDLLSHEDCQRATGGVSLIYHLAAGFDKSFAGAFMNSALATRNLMDAYLEMGQPKRFVNVSSFAVYSNLRLKRGTVVDETCSLEDSPQERFDGYGFGKLKQEQLVREYGNKHKLPYVILRPGYVFGPGKRELNGRVGIDTFGFFVQVGGSNCLPLTFVDNCADAIVLAGLQPGIDGETFNVVDDELMSGRQFLNAYKKVKRFRSIRLPYSFAYGLCALWEKYSHWSKGQLPPAFNRRRCAAEWKPMRYSNSKLKERVGWKPRVPMNQAIQAFLGQFDSKEKVKADTLKC